MLLIVFIAFFALVLAWLVAPNGEIAPVAKPVQPVAPKLATGEAAA